MELELVLALPFGIAAGQWGSPVIPLIADSPVVIAVLAVAVLSGALYAVRFGEPLAVANRRGVVAAVLWPATCWTALDFLRVLGDPGSYWGPLFLSQADTPAVHLSALGGPWVVTFALVSINYELARRLTGGQPRPRLKTAVVGALTVLPVAWLASPLARPPAKESTLTVAAIQPGYDTAEPGVPVLRFWKKGSYDVAAIDVIGDLAALTHEAAARGAELVVWPEGAVFSDVLSYAPARDALEELSRRTKAAVVVPYFLPSRRFGKSVVVAPGGEFAPPQAKQRPMWFLGERGSKAPAPTPVTAQGRSIAALLGTDNKDPGLAARFAREGASLIASSTHDWEELSVPQRRYARLNAASTGQPVVRSDWRYGSAVYDGAGRVLGDAGLQRRRAVVLAELSGSSVPTPYARVGDLAGWLAVGAAAAGLLFGAYRLGSL